MSMRIAPTYHGCQKKIINSMETAAEPTVIVPHHPIGVRIPKTPKPAKKNPIVVITTKVIPMGRARGEILQMKSVYLLYLKTLPARAPVCSPSSMVT